MRILDLSSDMESKEDEINLSHQKIWDSVSINYEMIQGA
jgi:hypothetical protein